VQDQYGAILRRQLVNRRGQRHTHLGLTGRIVHAWGPVGDGFGNNDELDCNYCGVSFKASVDDEGKLKMKES